MEKQDFQARIKAIIEDRLVRVTPEVKEILPAILWGEIEFFTQLTDTYFALIFINDVEKERIRKLRERNIQPFPFLINLKELPAVPLLDLKNPSLYGLKPVL